VYVRIVVHNGRIHNTSQNSSYYFSLLTFSQPSKFRCCLLRGFVNPRLAHRPKCEHYGQNGVSEKTAEYFR